MSVGAVIVASWAAVGAVRAVAAELIPSLTSAPTVTEAVLVVLQLPALPLQFCALAWVAARAVASTIAANRERVAFIFVFSPGFFDGTGTSQGLKPARSKRLWWCTYKTKTDPSCNEFLNSFSERNPLTFRAGARVRSVVFCRRVRACCRAAM